MQGSDHLWMVWSPAEEADPCRQSARGLVSVTSDTLQIPIAAMLYSLSLGSVQTAKP